PSFRTSSPAPMGCSESCEGRRRVQNANHSELFSIAQDPAKEVKEQDFSEYHRQLLVKEENHMDQAHGSARGTSKPLKSHEDWCHLYFTLRNAPAILENMGDVSYGGHIRAGEIFTTDRVRHADSMRQMLADVGQEEFMGFVKSALPAGLQVSKPLEFIFPNGTPLLAMRLDIKSIQALQVVRNTVLSTELEIAVNKKLEMHANAKSKWQVRLDKTYFCKVFEKELLSFSELTKHQKEKLQNIEELLCYGPVHLSAVAILAQAILAQAR
ncbi:unnamed protein product, partial [Cladocopium goreaui]